MANTNLIYTYIQDSGYKLQYVASVLHISSNTLRHKLLGETQFKLDEAERLSTVLGLTMAERDACFFDAENRFSRSATLELPKRGNASDTGTARCDPERPAQVRRASLGAHAGKPPLAKRH